MLNEITQLQIPYLQKLDYIDLKNLCKTNKYYRNICQNEKLKQILYSKNENAKVIDQINIKETLDELDDTVERFYHESYPKDMKLPSFIKQDQLKDYIKRIIYDQIYYNLNDIIREFYTDDLLAIFEPNYDKGTFQISFETGDIATPFMLDILYANDEKAEKVQVYYELNLPISLLDYINESVIEYMKLYDNPDEHNLYFKRFEANLSLLIKDLLFL